MNKANATLYHLGILLKYPHHPSNCSKYGHKSPNNSTQIRAIKIPSPKAIPIPIPESLHLLYHKQLLRSTKHKPTCEKYLSHPSIIPRNNRLTQEKIFHDQSNSFPPTADFLSHYQCETVMSRSG